MARFQSIKTIFSAVVNKTTNTYKNYMLIPSACELIVFLKQPKNWWQNQMFSKTMPSAVGNITTNAYKNHMLINSTCKLNVYLKQQKNQAAGWNDFESELIGVLYHTVF